MTYIADKQRLDKKLESIDTKTLDTSNLVINATFNRKIGQVETKRPDVSALVTNATFYTAC